SMASITTNIKIGAGGAYSIISKSLGLEAGGSVGIPFYVSQTLSAALYIIGFTEGWLGIFPDHPPLLVSLLTWAVLMVISVVSTQFAIRIQYVIMVLIGLSLVSFFSMDKQPVVELPLLGGFEDAGFWQVFAIFFPAVTGIMAGANMSGDLKDPRKSIPGGTLWAIGITFVIYIALAVVMGLYIDSIDLRSNQMVMVDRASYGFLVLIGILAATFSSALGSILGSPRILQALAEHGTVPMSETFARRTKTNEPRNAMIFTGIVIVFAIVLGNLDVLATLITMFFLITYGM
ncbi:MAG: Na-K-Cl cotransporter, partial [Calditrichaeota bacterium]|nr:Na-K-Cl cotransporter [Calditrichota bacterium]